MIRCWHSCEGLGLPLDKTWTRLGLGLGTIQTSSPPADCTKQLLLQARQLLAKNTLGLSLSLDLCVSFSLGLHLVCTKQLILQTRQLLVNTLLGHGLVQVCLFKKLCRMADILEQSGFQDLRRNHTNCPRNCAY